MSTEPTLEAVTVIRVPPPGGEPDRLVAAVRMDDQLHVGRLLGSPPGPPTVGAPLELIEQCDSVPIYRLLA